MPLEVIKNRHVESYVKYLIPYIGIVFLLRYVENNVGKRNFLFIYLAYWKSISMGRNFTNLIVLGSLKN